MNVIPGLSLFSVDSKIDKHEHYLINYDLMKYCIKNTMKELL